MAQQFDLIVNGRAVSVAVANEETPLLDILRNELGLMGTRFGCGLEQCGCCMVLIDGEPAKSCARPVWNIAGRNVTTIEGLGTPDRPHPLQQAFIEEQAVQCGYCINGMIMESAAFLARNRKPTEAQVKEALANNLCRCGTHARIVRAVLRAASAR